MKILIACDMEGITGVVNWNQVDSTHPEYQRFRKIMTGDVNSAIKGAFDGGAQEVVVADGHGGGTNILVEELDSRARLNSSNAAPLAMMQGIDEQVNGVIFVGYHARQGSQNAICDHTWSSKTVANLWLNEVLTGEYGLNAALAGYFGVPVIMITGDQTACAQAAELLGPLETVVVKQATSRFSAECLPPEVTHKLIADSAKRAVQRLKRGDAPEPFILDTPVTVTIDLMTSDMADRAARIPGVQREANRVAIELPDMREAYMAFRAMVGMALAM